VTLYQLSYGVDRIRRNEVDTLPFDAWPVVANALLGDDENAPEWLADQLMVFFTSPTQDSLDVSRRFALSHAHALLLFELPRLIDFLSRVADGAQSASKTEYQHAAHVLRTTGFESGTLDL
jgi:hypothetical protein